MAIIIIIIIILKRDNSRLWVVAFFACDTRLEVTTLFMQRRGDSRDVVVTNRTTDKTKHTHGTRWWKRSCAN